MQQVKTDEDLASAVQGGDRRAAAELLSRHERGLLGFAFRLLRNREDAAEVTQEAMTRALTKIDRYDPRRPFAPWLYRITRNLCIDRYRRRRPTSELHEETTTQRPEASLGNRFGRSPDRVAQQQELNAALKEAMDTLSVPYREIVDLYHYQHMSYREIAEHLQIPDGTVMNRLFRARRKLQAVLTDRGMTP